MKIERLFDSELPIITKKKEAISDWLSVDENEINVAVFISISERIKVSVCGKYKAIVEYVDKDGYVITNVDIENMKNGNKWFSFTTHDNITSGFVVVEKKSIISRKEVFVLEKIL